MGQGRPPGTPRLAGWMGKDRGRELWKRKASHVVLLKALAPSDNWALHIKQASLEGLKELLIPAVHTAGAGCVGVCLCEASANTTAQEHIKAGCRDARKNVCVRVCVRPPV